MAASMKYVKGTSNSTEDLILANFKNGRLQISETGQCPNAPDFTFYKSNETQDVRKRKQRTLVAESQDIQYVGHNHGSHAPKANAACRYLVGVLDKKSSKMKVYDAQYFHLHPWLNTSAKDGQDETDEPNPSGEKTYGEKQDALTEAFGSIRKRRAADSRKKGAVGSDAMEKAAKKAVDIAKSQPTTPIKETMDSEGVMPTCNRDAFTVQDVYKLDDIITPHILQTLQKSAEKFCSANLKQVIKWQKDKIYSQYILDHIKKLMNEKAKNKEKTAAILLFIHNLSILHGLKLSELKKVPFEEDTPGVLKKYLLDTFTQASLVGDGSKEKRCLPKRMKDKILSHALVLALIIDDYKTQLAPLQSAFKVGVRVLESHAKALGCKVSSIASTPQPVEKSASSSKGSSGNRVAELSLPLRISRTPRKLGGKKKR